MVRTAAERRAMTETQTPNKIRRAPKADFIVVKTACAISSALRPPMKCAKAMLD
jgi:hypothetical protein